MIDACPGKEEKECKDSCTWENGKCSPKIAEIVKTEAKENPSVTTKQIGEALLKIKEDKKEPADVNKVLQAFGQKLVDMKEKPAVKVDDVDAMNLFAKAMQKKMKDGGGD